VIVEANQAGNSQLAASRQGDTEYLVNAVTSAITGQTRSDHLRHGAESPQ